MNIQELENLKLDVIDTLSCIRHFGNNYSSIVENISKIFKQYEQSNKSEEEPIQDIKKYIDDKLESYRQLNARYNMDVKAEIETLKKQVEAIDKMKIIDNSIEPKERLRYFYTRESTEDCFHIHDSQSSSTFIGKAKNSVIANRMVNSLNSTEASK